MKIIVALWSSDVAGLQTSLRSELCRAGLATAGATRLQLNLDDDQIDERALRLQAFDAPLASVVSLWSSDPGPVEVLRAYADTLAAWEVEERVPLAPPQTDDGARADALAQVAFLRRPPELPYADWLAHWHGPHTQIAMQTQGTFGYVQNRVLRALDDDTPQVDAVVEELFPSGAVEDIHVFYGTDGTQADLDRRLGALMQSVATMGADRGLDVVPSSRYTWQLG